MSEKKKSDCDLPRTSGKWEIPNLGKSLSVVQTSQTLCNLANLTQIQQIYTIILREARAWLKSTQFITGGVVFVNLTQLM
jgi:hypothetical protein